ncbi:MAG: GNAT family N-acetyltransferase [Gemmatimonadales bacterium]
MPRIRAARDDDEPFLLALTSRLADFPLPPWRTAREIADADHQVLLDALHQPRDDAAILVAEDAAGRPSGYVFLTTRSDYFTGRPIAHVEVLAIEVAAQGSGAARALMEAGEAWACGRGYHGVTLNVFANNRRAQGLYEHLGYQAETLHYFKAL